MQRIGSNLFALSRRDCQGLGVAPSLQKVQQALFSGTHVASQKKENIGQADSETTKGVAAGEKSTKSPGGAPESPETTSQAPGGSVRPGFDPSGKDKGQHAATQKKQEPESGNEPAEGDIRKAKTYTTASAAWNQNTPRAMRSNSPALAKGPWGQSRSIFTGSVLAAYQRPGERSDTGSDQGSMSEGHSDPNTGAGTGGPSSGLPLDTDPKDATSTDRIDDPEQLFKRRRAKDPIAFDKVHGKGATLSGETDGHAQESDNSADKMTNQDGSKHLGGREGKQQTMGTNTKQAASFLTWSRGFFSSAAVGAGNEEGQKKAGNPYAPTSSAGGTPTDNQKDESKLPNEAKQVQMSGQQKETPTQPGSDRMPKNSGKKNNVQTGNSLDKDNAVSPEGVGGP